VYTNQRLNLSKLWEGLRRICQGFKPDSVNLTVRDYRGASENVRHGGNVNPPRNRKSGSGNPLTYSVARPISIPVDWLQPARTLRTRVKTEGGESPTGAANEPVRAMTEG
jgi:hypothetical protein